MWGIISENIRGLGKIKNSFPMNHCRTFIKFADFHKMLHAFSVCLFCLFKHTNMLNVLLFFLQDCLRACQEQIEQTLAVNLSNMAQNVEPTTKMDHTSTPHHSHSHNELKEQPTTPTDVKDIHFQWYMCTTNKRKNEEKTIDIYCSIIYTTKNSKKDILSDLKLCI